MWKGKTRGGVSGYLFFIYLIRYCGVKAAYGFLSLIVLYFIPFAPKATKSIWQYARRILKRNRIQSVGLLLNNYYRLGQILIDKVAIGNGMIDKFQVQPLSGVSKCIGWRSGSNHDRCTCWQLGNRNSFFQ